MTSNHADLAVIGGGIVGMAHALAAAKAGYRVVLFERDQRAVGASIRNFGLGWPIGQPDALRPRAERSRDIWLDVANRSGMWHADSGSLTVAYRFEEQHVLEEFLDTTPSARDAGCRLLTPQEVEKESPSVRTSGLRCALYSPTEINVDPREAIPAVAEVLRRDFDVDLRFGVEVHAVNLPNVQTTAGEWRAERAIVCSGADFQTLYPQVYEATGIRRCKLQMLRTVPQPRGWELGPALCAGLTLLHYPAFAHCESLRPLRDKLTHEYPYNRENGIHVLVSQTARGEVTIGDSHEYSDTHDPFEYEEINAAILDYFDSFVELPRRQIAERWHGIYPSLPGGKPNLTAHPEPGVTVVNGLGGAGMTLSFGLAEETLAEMSAA